MTSEEKEIYRQAGEIVPKLTENDYSKQEPTREGVYHFKTVPNFYGLLYLVEDGRGDWDVILFNGPTGPFSIYRRMPNARWAYLFPFPWETQELEYQI